MLLVNYSLIRSCHGVKKINKLFHSILFYYILFYSILFYSILFYSILFYAILFYSILFYSILFYSVPFHLHLCTLHTVCMMECMTSFIVNKFIHLVRNYSIIILHQPSCTHTYCMNRLVQV